VGVAAILLADLGPSLRAGSTHRARPRLLLQYLATWAAVVVIPYLLIGTVALGLRDPADFKTWMSRYSELGWWWDFHVAKNLGLDAYALRHAGFVEPPGTLERFTSAGTRLSFWVRSIGQLSPAGLSPPALSSPRCPCSGGRTTAS